MFLNLAWWGKSLHRAFRFPCHISLALVMDCLRVCTFFFLELSPWKLYITSFGLKSIGEDKLFGDRRRLTRKFSRIDLSDKVNWNVLRHFGCNYWSRFLSISLAVTAFLFTLTIFINNNKFMLQWSKTRLSYTQAECMNEALI